MESAIKNPFLYKSPILISNDEDSDQLVELDITNFTKYFDKVYVICLRKDTDIGNIQEQYFGNKKFFDELNDKFILYEIDNLQNIRLFFKYFIHIDSTYVENFNIFGYNLENKILCLPLFNIKFLDLQKYFDSISKKNNLESLYKNVVLNNYLSCVDKYDFNSQIKNLDESKYWLQYRNCKHSFSDLFFKRQFDFGGSYKLSNDIKSVIKKLKESNTTDNYLDQIYSNICFTDPSKTSLRYNLYNLKKKEIFSKKDIRELLTHLPFKSQILLIFYLLASRDYCHLVVNNIDILSNQNYMDIINGYYKDENILKYLLGYCWNRLYLEECVKKTYFTKDDDFVFDINTASMLPVYEYDYSNPYNNPYMTMLVKESHLIPKINILGVNNNKNHRRICNIEEFKMRFNMFTTDNHTINIFDSIDFKKFNMAISGSIMTACIQVRHPLMSLFESPNCHSDKDYINNNLKFQPQSFKRFCDEYYTNSDIDVMLNNDNIFDFLTNIKEIHKIITENIIKFNSPYAEKDHVKLIFKKSIYLKVKKNYIYKQIIDDNITYEKLIDCINENDVKKKYFSDIIKRYYENIQYDYSEYTDFNPEYFIEVPYDNINIYIYSDDYTFIDSVQEHTIVLNDEIQICSNIRGHISSPYINHDLELFKIRGPSFGVVSKFHLPCVRAYYDGETVYMLPSCITAHMTYMNIDYKYFSGHKDPLEIINKYRMRGFGTYLNKNEVKDYVNYIKLVPFWSTLYYPDSILSRLTVLKLNHKLFKPRYYNHYYYNNEKITPLEKDDPYNKTHLVTSYNVKFKKHIIHRPCINKHTGFINPLQLNFVDEIFYKYINTDIYKKYIKKTFGISHVYIPIGSDSPVQTVLENTTAESYPADSWGAPPQEVPIPPVQSTDLLPSPPPEQEQWGPPDANVVADLQAAWAIDNEQDNNLTQSESDALSWDDTIGTIV